MISIISGPTCVGKTYFIENKKDRILELSNLPPTTESYVTGSFSSNHSEFPDVVSHWIKRYDGRYIVDQIFSIHYNWSIFQSACTIPRMTSCISYILHVVGKYYVGTA